MMSELTNPSDDRPRSEADPVEPPRIAMQLNCPHCHNPIEVLADWAEHDVLCPSCGDTFRVDPYHTRPLTREKLQQLGKFELIQAVGHGTFGTVYRARDKQLDRTVAVKVPRSGQLATEEDEDRFLREARNAAQLQHTGIVPVFEVGRSDMFPYIVSEFVEGVTLADALSARRFGFRESAQLMALVAAALEHAHGHGVVHRDLKPANIMLTPEGNPRIMDFGLSKREAGEVTMTVEGEVLGTPAYMSPEQASGQSHQVDGRTDIYSLGGMLYELLTGELPFRGNQRMLLHQVMHDEPRSPRTLNDRIPRDLETICLKAMAKEPGRRYQSARALAEDLTRYLTGKPIAARPVGHVERSWRWCRRNPLVASMAALLILVVIGAFVSVTSQWLVTQSALRRMQEAQMQRAAAQVEALLKAAPESLTPILNNMKPQYDDIAPELRRLMTRRDLSDHDRLRVSLALLPGDPRQVSYLRDRMLSIGLAELLAVREALVPYQDLLREDLWSVLNSSQAKPESRFSAALILAHGEADESQRAESWQAHSPFLAARLLDSVSTDPSSYEPLVAALRPVRRALWPTLVTTFRDRRQPQSVRAFATNILVSYAADQPVELARLLVEADPWQFLVIRPRLTKSMADAIDLLILQLDEAPPAHASDSEKEAAARRRATTAVALLQLGVGHRVWPLLVHSDDPRVRSHLIELFCLLKTDPRPLIARLDEEPNASARRAILLALGSYEQDQLAEQDRRTLIDRCANLYASDPDAGIHAASEWVLRHWGQSTALLAPAVPRAGSGQPAAEWYLGPEGHTLAVIDGRASATIGSPKTEQSRSLTEKPHPVTIGRKFALGTKEVTVDQFRRFIQATGLKMPPFTSKHSPDDNGPMIMITWYRAAQYCRWLSEQAGLPEDQMCYPAIDEIREGLQPRVDYLKRTGFRLPTEAEWEFSARAGATTSRAFGSSEELLPHYAWYLSNASDRAWPCGNLKPNDFGLFDMHGNVWEWCGEHWTSYFEKPTDHDSADLTVVDAASNRVLRGGSFDSAAKAVRSAFRDRFEKPQFGSDEIGFRIARTLPD
ncbi:MAG: SUMF1/EgtB/PvdO family nonheme iron enzyme [Planctomycetia bacterium]|nr:SUMF1/EgtB/PvdO family nonheme iron enzyme [Planctomycetia bacterium]